MCVSKAWYKFKKLFVLFSASLQFLTQKEFQQIKLEQLMATSSPAAGKKRTAEELMAAEEDQQLVATVT